MVHLHEHRTRNTKNAPKRRNSIREDECRQPEQRTGPDPNTPRDRRVVCQPVPSLDNLVHGHVVHVLDTRVAENETGAKQSREEQSVGNFAGHAGRRAECGRDDVLAGQVVNDAGCDDVHGYSDGV